ncbi:MAG: peptidoglycan recognition family protein [Dehalococcoidia bacterium]
MKGENPNKYKRILLRCVYAMAVCAVVFIFTDARAKNDKPAYDEMFKAGNTKEVTMSLSADHTNETATEIFSLPAIGNNVYAATQKFSIGPFTASRPFILLSARWDESRAEAVTDVTLRVRARNTNSDPWSEWQELEQLKDFRDERDVVPGRVRTEPLMVDESREFEVQLTLTTLDPRVTPQVANLSFTAIGTQSDTPPLFLPLTRGRTVNDNHKGPPLKKGEDEGGGVKAALNGAGELNIITRASWSADESLRVSATGEDLWPETHGEVKAFVVHHTGGTNGGSDPAATVRAIQRYHGKTLGWGDIGYNYLIAPDGRIYEGRRGGEGVVGGHTYNDKKKIGYNTGTIGIAILGNYDSKDTFTDAARESLAKLITEKSFEHEIIPDGENTLKDISIPAVIAHKDIDATICPGAGIMNELIRVRQLARADLDAQGGLAAITRRATFVGQSDSSILIKPGQSKTIWISYRNDGNTSWKNYLNSPVQLADASVKQRLAALSSSITAALTQPSASFRDENKRDVPRLSASMVRMAQVVDDEVRPLETPVAQTSALTFTQPNVAPGETVIIPLAITMPPNAAGVENRDYILTWGNIGYFPGSDFHIAIETTEAEWAGKVEFLETPTTTRTGVLTQGVVRVRNRGLKTWLKGSVMLLLTDIAGGEPKWDMAGWPLPMGRILSNEATVKPNEVATFPLPLTATTPGFFETLLSFKYLPDIGTVPSTLIETLKLPDLPGASGSFATTVAPSGQIELIKPQFPTRIRPSRTVYLTLRVKNTGDKILKGGKTAFLTQTSADGAKSPFYVKSDWLSDTKPTYLYQTSLKPGKVGTFTWRMKAPAKKGTYTEKLTFTTAEGGGLINGKTEYTFTVKVE